MTTRPSLATSRNAAVTELKRDSGQTNRDWLNAAIGNDDAEGSLLLIGGCGLTDFRLRIAQSQVRGDLLPSFWSHVALIRSRDGNDGKAYKLYEVSLEPGAGFGNVPKNNGVQEALSTRYDDPARYPNLAWLKFPVSTSVLETEVSLKPAGKKKAGGRSKTSRTLLEAMDENVGQFRKRRGMLDMPAVITEWLGFTWGVSDRANPILKRIGIPSAVFAESVYAMLGIELTPGLATQSSCPEAIWQAATWWHDFYASSASLTSAAPSGRYVIGQSAAAVLD